MSEHVKAAVNDAAIASCIQGAKELGQSLADAVKQIEWLRLVLKAVSSGAAELWAENGAIIIESETEPATSFDVQYDSDGIPVYSEELAAALRAAME